MNCTNQQQPAKDPRGACRRESTSGTWTEDKLRLLETLVTGWPAVLILALVAVLLFLRAPDTLLHPQFWAEDSVVFFDHALQQGTASLARPHASYLNGIPRLIALACTPLPARYSPWLYNWSAYLIALGTMVLISRSRFRGHAGLGLLAVLVFALTPHLSHEIFWSLTNIQWTISAYLLILLAVDAPKTLQDAWWLSVFTLLAGTTSPLAAVLLPVFLARLWLERKSLLALPLGAASLSGLLQAWVIHTNGTSTQGVALPSVPYVLEIIGRRIFIQGFVPVPLWPAASQHTVLAGVIGLLLIGWGLFSVRKNQLLCLLLLGGVALMTFASLARTDASLRDLFEDPKNCGFGDRYFLPIRFTLGLYFLLLTFSATKPVRWMAGVLLCLIPFASYSSFVGPSVEVQHWETYAPLIDAKKPVDIPVNPGWTYHYRPPVK